MQFRYFGFILLIISIAGFLFMPTTKAADLNKAVYYVSPNGDDSNFGTLEAPWKTIQKAADTLEAGEMVFIREGIYKEFVTIKKSGSKEGSILYKAYPGEQPVLDGTGVTVDSEKSVLMYLENASYIVIDGFELRNITTDDPDVYPAGIRVREGGHHIQLVNNNVHHIANKSKKGNAHGIHVYGNTANEISDLLIKGNEVHHLTLGNSEALTINGNVNGFSVENNRVHDNNNIGIDIAGFYNACQAPCIDQARNGKVVSNKVFNNSSINNPSYEGHYAAGGIYADGSTDVIIEKNIVYNNDFGIELASENAGKQTSSIKVSDNLIYKNNGAGIIMGGASSSNGGTSKNSIINNILKHNDQLEQGYGQITLQWNNVDNQIMHNEIYSNAPESFIQQDNDSGTGNVITDNYLIQSAKIFSYFEKFKTNLFKLFW
ncbi:right-handed parallel beta-helix repeat-containing protein [Sporosarcina sp. ANT_H38]|uniref:right-handed parallel beta-helix repeat-containing protein n=1 Tax=Sporosarcina sp. ANT_H38 TaxID=2597358 RepID=UPI00165E7029|nr:right-handed parallel beta-helix repeat-containing protein [Sporosarcina sp. ANT_H38]